MNHPALDVLFRQRDAWNRGDRAGYLAECAPDIVYVSARGAAFGREAVAQSLTDAYPDPRSMGTLALDILNVEVAPAQVRVVLNWRVQRDEVPTGGAALLILAERAGVWQVTHDATVSTPAPTTRPSPPAGA